MKAKFASDLSNFSEKELNQKLYETNVGIGSMIESTMHFYRKLSKEIAKLIVAGANPNLVVSHGWIYGRQKVDHISSLLSAILRKQELHTLIPLLLIYGADVNGKEMVFLSDYDYPEINNLETYNVQLAIHPDYFPSLPMFQPILWNMSDRIDVLKQLINYDVDLNVEVPDRQTPLKIASSTMHNPSMNDVAAFLRENGAK